MLRKTMTLLFVLSMFYAVSQRPPAPRQENQTPPSKEEMLEKVTKELELTSEQAQKWSAVHEKYEDLRKQEAKNRAEHEKMGKELEGILTEDQIKKFKELRKKQRPPRPQKD